MELVLAAVVNFAVGGCVGICGVAGFLLPMFYVSRGMSTVESLALSFSAFIVSGFLGSVGYKKQGNIDFSFGTKLGIGSITGALIGVRLNLILPEQGVKTLLYIVVLASGLSILFRKECDRKSKDNFKISEHIWLTLIFGFITGAICSISGAGGPVLVMPLLVLFGIPVRTAVGISLYDSIFIGVPSAIGYLSKCEIQNIITLLFISLIFHGAGVLIGSKNAVYINQSILKKGVAVGSVILAVFKLATL